MSIEALYEKLSKEIHQVVYGMDQTIDFALASLFSSGHLLIEGVPGTAKTLLVRTIASTMEMDFCRIQMTPDLLPTDILGLSIFQEEKKDFVFRQGPVFTNFLLADELNRASARTQSALLEAMQELHVTYDSKDYELPSPFIVFATQNSIEQEGTYPLPMAQLDRFMFKVIVDYPDADTEEQVLRNHHATGAQNTPEKLGVSKVVGPGEILEAREIIRATFVREELIQYIRKLLQNTRNNDDLSVGASPRAGLMLLMGAKSFARFDGRDYVTPDDIKTAFLPSMRHRVVLSASAELEGISEDEVLVRLLDSIEVPR